MADITINNLDQKALDLIANSPEFRKAINRLAEQFISRVASDGPNLDELMVAPAKIKPELTAEQHQHLQDISAAINSNNLDNITEKLRQSLDGILFKLDAKLGTSWRRSMLIEVFGEMSFNRHYVVRLFETPGSDTFSILTIGAVSTIKDPGIWQRFIDYIKNSAD